MKNQTEGNLARYRYYVLDGRTPVPARSHDEWLDFMFGSRKEERWVARDCLQSERYGMICLSTVFLGIPHPPNEALFESIVFRETGTDRWGSPPPDDLVAAGFWGEQERYTSYDAAEAGHARLLAELRGKSATTDHG